MYHGPSLAVTGPLTGTGTTVLATTGLNTAHSLVAVATLVFFGLALLRLVPRRES